jgi:hypothetical protein
MAGALQDNVLAWKQVSNQNTFQNTVLSKHCSQTKMGDSIQHAYVGLLFAFLKYVFKYWQAAEWSLLMSFH